MSDFSRRSFLPLAASGVTAAEAMLSSRRQIEIDGLVPQPKEPEPQEAPDRFERNGWEYCWAGWRCTEPSVWEYGIWIAKAKTKRPAEKLPNGRYMAKNMAYQCTTGTGDWYNFGEIFNICTKIGHWYIDPYSTDEQRKKERDMALTLLMRFIDSDGTAPELCHVCWMTSEERIDHRDCWDNFYASL